MNSAFSGELFSDGFLLIVKYSLPAQNNGYMLSCVYCCCEWEWGYKKKRRRNELEYNKKRLIYGESNNFRSFIVAS